jgi:diguanylate cyclase (GGDEF)-like protein
MLIEVANALKAQVRPYDLVIRLGGDEFICAIVGLNLTDAKKRLALVNSALERAPERGSVTVGLAELRPGDSPEKLVARADAALPRKRPARKYPRMRCRLGRSGVHGSPLPAEIRFGCCS